MYNEKIKNQFIDYETSTTRIKDNSMAIRTLQNLFSVLEEYETGKGKDFAMFNYAEMVECLSDVMKKSLTYQKNTLSRLKKYVKWCIENGHSLDGENRLEGLNATELDFSQSYPLYMIKDEDQLSECLDVAFRPMNDDSKDSMYRTMIYLIYCGIQFEDTFMIKKSNIDTANKTMKFNGKSYVLTDRTVECINYVNGMDKFTYGEDKNRPLSGGDYIIRTSSEDREKMINSARTYCSKILNEAVKKEGYQAILTFSQIWKSGIFNRAWENEKGTSKINLGLIENSKENLLEYHGWKKAFNLES